MSGFATGLRQVSFCARAYRLTCGSSLLLLLRLIAGRRIRLSWCCVVVVDGARDRRCGGTGGGSKVFTLEARDRIELLPQAAAGALQKDRARGARFGSGRAGVEKVAASHSARKSEGRRRRDSHRASRGMPHSLCTGERFQHTTRATLTQHTYTRKAGATVASHSLLPRKHSRRLPGANNPTQRRPTPPTIHSSPQ